MGQLGAGSNIVLHDLVWYQEDGKYYDMVYIYNMEGIKLTFQISPDTCSLKCRYTPCLKAPMIVTLQETFPFTSTLEMLGLNSSLASSTFPTRSRGKKECHLSKKVAITGVSPDSSLVTVKAARPGGIVLIYRLAGQTSQVTTQIEYENFGVLLEE
ncbi:hypothetical protein BDR26DRAFT_891534 [Obelidium mucronatum]|nr:hypothetical protein BDR26DRAFT_891534 [Obelidium mucronatum]